MMADSTRSPMPLRGPTRALLAAAGFALSSMLAAVAAWYVASWLAGPNVSDLGVRMYTHGALARLGGGAVYSALASAGIMLVARVLRPGPRVLRGVGGGLAVAGFSSIYLLLWFSYG
jgi:hypothetical protein